MAFVDKQLYTYQQKLVSIRKTDFISLIVDETQDISVHKMVSICLRYVGKDTGTIQEQIFKIEPITDTPVKGIANAIFIK